MDRTNSNECYVSPEVYTAADAEREAQRERARKLYAYMPITFDREVRRKQKEFLRTQFADYDPKRHEAFVERHNTIAETEAMKRYRANRGI